MNGFPELTIGEVARRAGVATSSIRYYERIGLLPKPDRSGGQRRYDAEVLGKLGFIGVAQSAWKPIVHPTSSFTRRSLG